MNINEQKQEEILGQAILVEMSKLFGGMKVFVLVPKHSGISPAEVQKRYAEQMDMLIERALQPTPREMFDMSIAGMPALIERALAKEN